MTDPPTPTLTRARPAFRAGLLPFMSVVATCATLLYAWRLAAESEPLPTLIRELGAADPAVRRLAAEGLAAQDSSDAGVVVPALLGAAGDPDPLVRTAANWSLSSYARHGGLDPGARRAVVRALINSLGATEPEAREASAAGLGWLASSSGHAVTRRARATGSVGLIDEPAPVVAALVDRLGDQGYKVRLAAIRALGEIGAASDIPTPDPLVAAIEQKQAVELRTAAVAAAGRFPNGTDEASRAFVRGLASGEPAVARVCEQALSAVLHEPPGTPRRTAVVRDLARSLRGPSPQAGVHAARLLGQDGSDALDAADALIEAVLQPPPRHPSETPDQDDDPRFGPVANALGAVTQGTVRAGDAVVALAAMAGSSNLWRRQAAARALLSFSPQELVPAGSTAIRAMNEAARGAALTLGPLDSGSAQESEVVAALAAALGSKNPRVRAEAARALEAFGPKANSAADALRSLAVDDPDKAVRAAATRALGVIGAAG